MSALEDLIQLVDNPSDIDQLNEAWVTGLSSRAEQELKDATTYLTQVLADRENAYKEIRDMNTPMVCGHAGRYAVNEKEGTQYCSVCNGDALFEAGKKALIYINKMNEFARACIRYAGNCGDVYLADKAREVLGENNHE